MEAAISVIRHHGEMYIFPPWEDGSIKIVAIAASGSGASVVLDREATRALVAALGIAVNDAPETNS